MGFHRPMKDQCDLCTRFSNYSSEEDKSTLKEEYEQCLDDHKMICHVELNCKERSESSTEFEAYAFDL